MGSSPKLLCLFLCLALTVPCYATNGLDYTPTSEEDIINYALHFMSASQADRKLDVSNFIHLTDGNGQDTGYYISFSSNGIAAGYLILSLLTEGSPVVEFSFEGYGPIETANVLMEAEGLAVEDRSNNQIISTEIVYTGADSMFIPLQTGEYWALYQQELVDLSEYTENEISVQNMNGDVDIYQGIIDWSEAKINSNSVFKIDKFGSGTDYWLMTQFSSGNVCSATAATNILWYWGYQRGCSSIMNRISAQPGNFEKASLIFDLVRIGMHTSETDGTNMNNILGGYSTFFGSTSRGEWSHAEIANGSSFDKFETMLRRNLPIHLSVRTNAIPFLGKGHDVMAMGVAESISGEDYIFVMDGWYNYGRFVKYGYYPYMSGYAILVFED